MFIVYLSKAFDTVDHETLLKKLYYYGVRGRSLDWFLSFLSNGFQFVEIKQQRSSSLHMTTGFPQGSTLDPLLNIFYNNDLNNSLLLLKSIHFVDDTILQLDINPSTVHTSLINSELAQLQTWINANKLSLNVKETNFMIISNGNQIENMNISLSGQPIAQTSHRTGCLHCNKLKFDTYINKLCSMVSQSIEVMRRISYLVPM